MYTSNRFIPTILLLFLTLLLWQCKTPESASGVPSRAEASRQTTQPKSQSNGQPAHEGGDLTEEERLRDLLSETGRLAEALKAENRNLHNSYRDLKQRYDALLQQTGTNPNADNNFNLQNNSVTPKSGVSVTPSNPSFTGEEDPFGLTPQPSAASNAGRSQTQNWKLAELQARLGRKQNTMSTLYDELNQVLVNHLGRDASMTRRGLEVFVAINPQVIGAIGSGQLDQQGQQVIQLVAGVLRSYSDVNISVVGHDTGGGSLQASWVESMQKSLLVTQALIEAGVPGQQLTAAGKGFYEPLAGGNNPNAQLINERTEIIIKPNLKDIYDLLESRY